MNEAIIALGRFQSIRPQVELSQEESLNLLEKIHRNHRGAEASAAMPIYLKRFGVKPQQIAKRGFENPELSASNADILERTRYFSDQAFKRCQEFYPENIEAPSHLLHVTCTGYVSPSPVQRLVNERRWNSKTDITHAYHMGCYASLPAIRIAEGFFSAKKKSVEIVHTELCSLHLDGRMHEPEQLVVQTLFADGYVKYTASAPSDFEHGFRVLGIKEQMIEDSGEDMTWITSAQSMRMTLSRQVPEKIGKALREFIQQLTKDFGSLEIIKTAKFAVHPGGPKIIDAVRETLELREDQVSISREILRTHGNMSSATLPHVWEQMLKENVQGPVISLAFGPGLTIYGAVFEAY